MCQGTTPLASGSLALPRVSGSHYGASAHDEGGVTRLIKLDVDQYDGNRSRRMGKAESGIVMGKHGGCRTDGNGSDTMAHSKRPSALEVKPDHESTAASRFPTLR